MQERIRFMRLDRQFADLRDEIMPAVEAVFAHGQVLQGPEVRRFEEEIARAVGRKHAVAVGSGTDALYLSLKAAGIKPGDRVAVTAFTFIASASAIVRAGGVPVFVDIGEAYQPDGEALLELVRSGQVAGLVSVHMFGQMAALSEVHREAKKRGMFVVEDAAQCLGARRNGSGPGADSDAACLSFDPTKIVGAQGSGGAVVTDSAALADRVARLRYHGKTPDGRFAEFGYNSQLPTVQAAILSVKLKRIEDWIERRIDIAGRYSAVLSEVSSAEVPAALPGNRHVYHKYVARIGPKRDAFASYLKARGVDTTVHYGVPLHLQPVFQQVVPDQPALPRAEAAAGEVLSFPIYPELTDAEVDYICDRIRQFKW